VQQFALEGRELSSPQNTYQEIGKFFTQARQERRLNLFDVEQSLHIRQVYLEAIEQGNLSILPGRVYTFGFMKKYAEFLDLDYQELQRRLDLGNDEYTSVVVDDMLQPYTMASHKKPIWLSLIFVVLGGGGYTYFHLHSAPEDAIDFIPEPPALIEPAATEGQQLEQEAPSEVATIPLAEPVVKPPSLVLHAKEPTWIDLRDTAGQVIFSRVLKKGESYTLPNQRGLLIAVGNAGGLEVRKDEVLLPSLGGHGQVRKGLSVDHLFSLND